LIHIRSPITSDKEKILAFCTDTFSWGDYIHEVYDSWMYEGQLIILEDNGEPIGMCHGIEYVDENILWIEGIRIRPDQRKKGFAANLVLYLENKAKKHGITNGSMLIESENIPSLNLAKKLVYKIQAQWNYFSLESKKNSLIYQFDSINFDQLDRKDLRYVESWRWIPITQYNFDRLNSNNNILCVKNKGKVQSLGIITESISFEDTIILTIVFGIFDDIQNMIVYVQNLSAKRNYSKIRIITELNELPPIENIGKKFPFYLVEKKF